MHRIGIIPFDINDQAMALLFVTSQTRGRWIFPKGLPKKNEKHVDTCHREGFEEAGVRGVVLKDFPLTLLISKQTSGGVQQIPATYYPFLVQEQKDDWPDHERRERHWALLEDAPKVTYREDFLTLIKQFEALAPWIREAAEQYKS
jgi:8-oxo-dGTP pyrophosphatase MutT (NUDIX family)